MRRPSSIDSETLRQWLDAERPVTILDVRTDEDRAEWSIPGSIHLNAYDDLQASRPSVLSAHEFAAGPPIVTVCNAGRMSERAAEELVARGLTAMSLAGGMRAWSLAWNTAAASFGHAQVIQVRRTGKGCLSYLIRSGGDAVVVDASLPADVYLSLAHEHGTRIRFVVETHIHADHLSRARSLAQAAGAELLLPAQDRARFPHRPIRDGDLIQVGQSRLRAIATPGHTMESTSYVLDDEAIFTGDTLFLGSVGRPDLHGNSTEARNRAALLYRSIQGLLLLPPHLHVFPGHTSEPARFDHVAIAATLGAVAQRLQGWNSSEAAFVDRVLSHLPATPPNYERIVALNEQGELPEGDPTELEAGANRCAAG